MLQNAQWVVGGFLSAYNLWNPWKTSKNSLQIQTKSKQKSVDNVTKL